MAYHAFFQSHVCYGTKLWGHAPTVHKVLLLQKRDVRLLSKAGYLDHCKPLFILNEIMTVHSVYIFQCVLAVRDNQSNYLLNSAVHDHRTRISQDVSLPRCRLNKTAKCFPVSGITFFNKIPHSIRALPRKNFLKTVKTWLLQNPIYGTTEFLEANLHDMNIH